MATAADIDEIVSGSFGLRLAIAGPLRLADLGGLDTYLSILQFLSAELGERYTPPALLETLVAEGRVGVKADAGIREYTREEAASLLHERDERLARLIAQLD